ncbi:hypothetical protein JMJ77_0002447 [Colletotrichum scovillei]|uniref:Uncharacterized protein n=1 Tax=Colletotrichum scovillei TaxID=1209932 RepID=A0A9P7UE68_9PEZI|nr:hypothetical protein JMJ77_0002447 [Colletotrichum scovillei]KAG7070864.1 hypothetical protein JMJ76_0002109 [Colletotrichum scovillei]KAG7079108.1 hypothetical protein JMJ78_0002769 [Colletotrichum scovillei]
MDRFVRRVPRRSLASGCYLSKRKHLSRSTPVVQHAVSSAKRESS